jgi:hypothetical protein
MLDMESLIMVFMSNFNKNNEKGDLFYMIFLFIFYKILNHANLESHISSYVSYMIKNFVNNENQYCVSFVSHEKKMKVGVAATTVKIIYSKTFKSILNYMIVHKKDLSNISGYREIMSQMCIDYYEEQDEFQLIPNVNIPILVDETNKIYCTIHKIDMNDENDKPSKSNHYEIKLYSNYSSFEKKSTTNAKVDTFIEQCLKEYEEKINPSNNMKQYIFQYMGQENSEESHYSNINFKEYEFTSNKSLDTNVFFEGKEDLIQYITPFIYDKINKDCNEGEKLYNKLGKTFSAGILLSGPPGCGKSSTIKAILNKTNRIGINVNLSLIKSNEGLENLFRNKKFNNKTYTGKQLCFIIEDCDADEKESLKDRSLKNNDSCTTSFSMSNDKDKKSDDGKNCNQTLNSLLHDLNKTFDLNCFLNILDGIIELHGVMVIMTTNYKEKLDKALIRDGRIDFKFEFKKANKKIIQEMLCARFECNETDIVNHSNFQNIKDYVLSPATIQTISFNSKTLDECINKILVRSQEE